MSEGFTALADASAIVGSHATRAQGTIGGNVMNASPAMDAGGPLLCFDGTVTLRSARAACRLRVGAVDRSRSRRAAADELLVAIDLPAPGANVVRATCGSSTGDRWRSPSWEPPAS